MVRRWFDERANRPYKDYLVSTSPELSAWQMAKLYDARGGMEVDIRGRQAGSGDREEEEEELPCPGSISSVGATGPQPAHLLRAMVFGRDQGPEAGGGAIGERSDEDAGRGEARKEGEEGPAENTAPSSVGKSGCRGH